MSLGRHTIRLRVGVQCVKSVRFLPLRHHPSKSSIPEDVMIDTRRTSMDRREDDKQICQRCMCSFISRPNFLSFGRGEVTSKAPNREGATPSANCVTMPRATTAASRAYRERRVFLLANQRRNLRCAARSSDCHRALASALQCRQTSLLTRIQAAKSANDFAASIRSVLRYAPARADAGHTRPDSNFEPGIAARGRPVFLE